MGFTVKRVLRGVVRRGPPCDLKLMTRHASDCEPLFQPTKRTCRTKVAGGQEPTGWDPLKA